jgi:hypothetical protein
MRMVAFSPDGTRIVTGNVDQTAMLWDARSGKPLLELGDRTLGLQSVTFSLDGTRIVTGSWGNTVKVWDARTGQELVGARIPPTPRPGEISPDGRCIAHIDRERVELIPLEPDEKELSERTLLMQPKYEHYREGYLESTKAGDEFVAKFYLNLVLPLERPLLQAEGIVTPLFARLLLRDDVLAAIHAQPAADPEIQAACLKLAATWPESAAGCNRAAWGLVIDPGHSGESYQRGLRLANVACLLEPDAVAFLNTLGVAQYRCGLLTEALATLTRTNALNKEEDPSDLAFLALAQQRLGQSEKARATLARLREVMKDGWDMPREAQDWLREAETIELDQVFPADVFAR